MITVLTDEQNGFGAFLMFWKWLGVGIVCFFLIPKAIADTVLVGNADAGRQKSTACVACHNADGNSSVPAWPKIAGLPEKYLIEQLKEYRKGDKGTRFNPVMYAIVQGLSDQDIADLAAFFASQKRTAGSTASQWVLPGEKIYRGGNSKTGVPACSACHSAKGEGNIPAGFPPLSGQQPGYVIQQLEDFKAGTRANDPNAIMRDISKRMSDEEREAVGNYVSGLH